MRKPNGQRTPLRGLRVPDHIWNSAANRAESDGITRAEVLNRLIEAYIAGDIEYTKEELGQFKPTSKDKIRNFRVPLERWQEFGEQASLEEVQRTYIVNHMLHDYASGELFIFDHPLP